MSGAGDFAALPTSARSAVQGLIRDHGMADYRLLLSEGSAKGDNFLGEITRIHVTGKVQGRESDLKLIMKLPPSAQGVREAMSINMLFRKEYTAYSDILPALNEIQDKYNIPARQRFLSARFYDGNHADMEEVLLFGDLAAEGFTMYDRLKSFDVEHLQLAVRNLARYHATSFALQKHNSKEFVRFSSCVSHKIDTGEMFYKMTVLAIEKLLTVIEDPQDRQVVERFSKGTVKCLDDCVDPALTTPYNVLCHGDCWSNNFLFRYEGGKPVDIRMVDWQMMRLASPVTDIAYMLFLGTDAATRKQHFHSMLDLYYSTLSDQLAMLGCEASRLYPEPVYRKQLKDVLPYGLIMSALVIPFTLSNRGDAPDLDKAFEGAENGEVQHAYSQLVIDRMNGVVKDCISYKVIS